MIKTSTIINIIQKNTILPLIDKTLKILKYIELVYIQYRFNKKKFNRYLVLQFLTNKNIIEGIKFIKRKIKEFITSKIFFNEKK